jgi:hypothetical protein
MHIGGAKGTMGSWQVISLPHFLGQFLAHGKFLAKPNFTVNCNFPLITYNYN